MIGYPVMTYREDEGGQGIGAKKKKKAPEPEVIKRGKFKDSEGKEWDLSEFDDTKGVSRAKKKK
jgi:hypothetical protein